MARSTAASRSKSTRSETDSFGPIEVPADRYWGAQTERSRQNFRIGQRPDADADRPRARHRQAGVGGNQSRTGTARPAPRPRHRPRRARGDRRQTRRSFSAGGLADRLRHPDQHEPQRGDRQSRQRTAGRRTRHQEAGSSQRSRQYEPVVERLVPDRDAHRRRDAHHRRSDSGARANCTARCARRKRRSPASSRSAAPIPRMRRR